MKYILIQNEGEIEINSFELIGASTKRDDSGKIGFFGSGLKYSIAYMMRNNISFRVFSGTNELKFTAQPATLKDKTFDRICINGNPTSYTVTMGPTWKEDWFVLREIYCNAIDESGCQLIRETETVNPSAGKTRIYIELTRKLKDVVDSWDLYFSEDREPLFTESDTYTSSMGTQDGNGSHFQTVKVYKKTDGILYRKGIRCYHNKQWKFDYGLENVNINEDRTASTAYSSCYMFGYLMSRFPSEQYVKEVLLSGTDDLQCSEYHSMYSDGPSTGYSVKWVEFSNKNILVAREISGRFIEKLSKTTKDIYLIPLNFAKKLKSCLPDVNIMGIGKVVGNVGMAEAIMTPKIQYLLNDVTKQLSQLNYKFDNEISVVHFEEDDTLGYADIDNKKIFLAEKLFDMGRREIATTIMEEVEHISSGKGDETRAFQNHLISSWLTSMENANGLFL